VDNAVKIPGRLRCASSAGWTACHFDRRQRSGHSRGMQEGVRALLAARSTRDSDTGGVAWSQHCSQRLAGSTAAMSRSLTAQITTFARARSKQYASYNSYSGNIFKILGGSRMRMLPLLRPASLGNVLEPRRWSDGIERADRRHRTGEPVRCFNRPNVRQPSSSAGRNTRVRPIERLRLLGRR
jgi:hypothetical protein